MRRRIIPLVLALACALPACPAWAETAAELAEALEQCEDQIAETEEEISALEAEILDTECAISKLEGQLEERRELLSQIMSSTYKSGGVDLLSALVSSQSLTELAAALHAGSAIESSEASAIANIEEMSETLSEVEEALEAAETELEAQQAKLEEEYQERELLLIEQEELEDSSAATIISKISNTDSGESPEEAAAYALTKVGCSYVWAASGPNSFDCSGLAMWAYALCGYSIPHNSQLQLNRVKSKGNLVYDIDALEVGDLVFFGRGKSTSAVYHVGIYIGDGKFVEAKGKKYGVVVSTLSYSSNYCGGGSPV